MKMNVYQEISQIIKEADGILIGASNGLSIAEGYNIFADDAWFQENIGDFRQQKRNIKDSFESILPEKSAFELSYKDSGGMYDKKCD